MSEATLYEHGESWQPSDDDESWWRERLALTDLLWTVTMPSAPTSGRITGVSAKDLHCPLVTVPAALRHLEPTIERWVTLDTEQGNGLDYLTKVAFRQWVGYTFQSAGIHLELYRNPLVASDRSGVSVSLLPLARAFADVLGHRASTRLRLLCGFAVGLSCLPEDDFAWHGQIDGTPLPLQAMSRAMSRWSALAAFETLRELEQSASDAAALELVRSAPNLLKGDIPAEVLPPTETQPFSTRSAWVAMDEPEIHLFASEARLLGQTLADHAAAGRTVIATHSLDLASRLVGACDFLTFDGPGRFECVALPSGIESLLQSLARHGAGILSVTRVLYVEGDWDVEILTRLFGNDLSQNNALLSPFHGVTGAYLAVTSIWHRMLDTPFGVMFDSLLAGQASREWAALLETMARRGRGYMLKELRHEIQNRKGGRYESEALLRLFHAVLDGRLEDRLRLVMHGLSDIFEVIHPSVFGLEAKSWESAGFDGRSGSFKDFLMQEANINLKDGRQCRLVLNAFDASGMQVEAAALTRLSEAINVFLAGVE